jgi:hypothetical protein
MKLKDWGYEKYLSSTDKMIIAAKAKKRAHDGKDTVFYHCNFELQPERIDSFKKRKIADVSEVVSPSAGEPHLLLKAAIKIF